MDPVYNSAPSRKPRTATYKLGVYPNNKGARVYPNILMITFGGNFRGAHLPYWPARATPDSSCGQDVKKARSSNKVV
jgi:hypothetical protein